MAYDDALAEQLRDALADRDVVEKKMFGGLAFLIGGNMCAAASGQGGLMLRCDPDETEDHIVDGAAPMIMRGKPMKGWLRVDDSDVHTDEELRRWVAVGAAYASSLPPK